MLSTDLWGLLANLVAKWLIWIVLTKIVQDSVTDLSIENICTYR